MFDRLLEGIRFDLEDFRQHKFLCKAKSLALSTGQHFNSTLLPQYFVGDLNADFVLIHLNPKQDDSFCEISSDITAVPSFDEYLDYFENFGKRVYGKDSPRTHTSVFDLKQIRFLKKFGIFDFREQRTADDKYHNLEIAIDAKLQLELIPYGSSKFNTSAFSQNVLSEHFARLLDTIASTERAYIFFCGSVFDVFLSDYVTNRYSVPLRKKDGTLTKKFARFSNLVIPYNGKQIRAGLAHTYAAQGLPIESYANFCREKYFS